MTTEVHATRAPASRLVIAALAVAALLVGTTACGSRVELPLPDEGDGSGTTEPFPGETPPSDEPPSDEPDEPPPDEPDEPPSTTPPHTNAMRCSTRPSLNLPPGELACYGVWDFGDAFGDDEDMCETGGMPKTGCTVSTSACASGLARTHEVVTIGGATEESLATIAANLDVTVEVLREEMVYVWVYDCM
ncbi:hypothetical protein [Chondromyces apiculatus]|nr:hypothetical protein [Chondromyces apiculatus]